MYSVRLLPSEYRMLHQAARKKDASLIIAMFVMGILLVVYLYLTFNAALLDNELAGIEAQNSQLEERISKLDDLEDISGEVTVLLNQVTTAAGTTPYWHELLIDFGNSIPETLSISNISMKYEKDSGEIIIQGISNDHQSVAECIKRLENLPQISDIKCNYLSKLDDSDGIQFEMRLSLLPGAGYRLKMEVAGE